MKPIKKRSQKPSLSVKRETIRTLSGGILTRAHGGMACGLDTCNFSCTHTNYTCNFGCSHTIWSRGSC